MQVMKSAAIAAFTVSMSVACASAQSSHGLKTMASKYSADETVNKFEAAIKAKGMKVFTRIDHQVAAKEAGLTMPASQVVIFGAPKGGTPNFLKKPTLAIDLPLKALIWQNAEGKVFLSYNSGAYVFGDIFGRHGLKPPAKIVEAQEAMLTVLAEAATK